MRTSLAVVTLLIFSNTAYTEDLKHRCPNGEWKSKLIVHHLSVGQGDSTFIRTPSGSTVLVDAGLPGKGKSEVLPTLKKCYGIQSIDYVVLTHFDQDHMGGLPEVLSEMQVTRALYDPGDRVSSKSKKPGSQFIRYKKAADVTGKRKVPELGELVLNPSDPTKITIVSVNGKILNGTQVNIFKKDGKTPKNDNAVCISLKIKFGVFDYFIGGDLTGGGNGTPDVESEVAKAVGDIDILHADHHGSATSNNETFLKTLRPELVVISVGDGGSNKLYHLPAANVMARLFDMPFIKGVIQTSRGQSRAPASLMNKIINADGDVVVVASPDSYEVNGTVFKTDEH